MILLFLLLFGRSCPTFDGSCDDTPPLVQSSLENDSYLLISTLDGAIYVLNRMNGDIIWQVKSEFPVLKLPHQNIRPLFLANPRDGAIYSYGSNPNGEMEKLPHSIPEMVSNSPFNIDGMLYTGKKQDSWYAIDLESEIAQKVVSMNDLEKTCPLPEKEVFYLGRTEYSVSIFDSMTQSVRWNATFYNFSSISDSVSPELYDYTHLSSDQSGNLVTLDKSDGNILWQQKFKSTVVGMYLMRKNDLLEIPFTTLSSHALSRLTNGAALPDFSSSVTELEFLPSLFIGRLNKGLYVLPTLVDEKRVKFISQVANIPLLPSKRGSEDEYNVDNTPIGYFPLPASLLPSEKRLQIEGNKSDMQRSLAGPLSETFDHRTHGVYIALFFSTFFCIACGALTYLSFKKHHQFLLFAQNNSSGSESSTDISYQSARAIDGGPCKVTIGKISFDTGKLLGAGCLGTAVYEGSFDQRPVAVKRIVPECLGVADREVELLRETDHHANVIRYFCMEKDSIFRYIALEMGWGTVRDYVEKKPDFSPGLTPITVLKQALQGLNHLHNLDICHRDIKPENVIISLPNSNHVRRVMISDFGLCKKLNPGCQSFSLSSPNGVVGTLGWIAPEIIRNKDDRSFKPTCSVDMFSLGCVFYYVITGGHHPFSDPLDEHDKTKRQANIEYDMASFKYLFDEETSYKIISYDLISSMLSKNPEYRPKASVALLHPFFWSLDKQLQYFQDVSDVIEKEEATSPVIQTLELNAAMIVKRNWRENVTVELQADLRKYRTYDGGSVRDLLRAMRNKKHHYRELPQDVKTSLGEVPEGFVSYFTSRFPRLLIHTYRAMHLCHKEPYLRKYYIHDSDSHFIHQ